MGEAIASRKLNEAMACLDIKSKTKTVDAEGDSLMLSEGIAIKDCEEVEIANEGWPWVGAPAKLLTQAPFALNQYNYKVGFFKLPEVKQVGRTS